MNLEINEEKVLTPQGKKCLTFALLSHVELAHLDPCGAVYDAVHDGVRVLNLNQIQIQIQVQVQIHPRRRPGLRVPRPDRQGQLWWEPDYAEEWAVAPGRGNAAAASLCIILSLAKRLKPCH